MYNCVFASVITMAGIWECYAINIQNNAPIKFGGGLIPKILFKRLFKIRINP